MELKSFQEVSFKKTHLAILSSAGMEGLRIQKRFQGLVEQGWLLGHEGVARLWNTHEM
jgi:hypothetical protein